MRPSKAIGTISFAALLLIAWWLFAPPQLGGRTSYAVIYGTSMNPRFHSGDLVLLRSQPNYQVGEIVGYHSQKLGRPVMHRIIKVDESGHYFFKGDNNNFVDPEHPIASQLFGKEWIRLPGVGTQLEKLHEPRNAAILAAAAAFFVLSGSGVRVKRRRRRRAAQERDVPTRVGTPLPDLAAAPAPVVHFEPAPAPAPAPPAAPAQPTSATATATATEVKRWQPRAAAALAAVGLAGVAATSILAIVAFTRAPGALVTETNLYTQHGRFGYSASVPVGPVYDHSPLHAGDALFDTVVHRFDVTFHYRLSAFGHMSLSGSAALNGVLSDGQGWTRHVRIATSKTFTGDSTSVRGVVDLDALKHLIARFQRATGSLNNAYELDVTPRVSVHGVVGSELVRDSFTPTLTFMWSQGRLRPAGSNDGATDNSLVREKSGTGTATQPRNLGAMGISTARRAAMIGLPLSIVASLLGGFMFMLVRGNDELAAIRRRYGSWVIDVATTERPPGVERPVDSIDALARIAERYERLILHEQRGPLHSFLVEDDGIVYRYDASEKSGRRNERGKTPPDGDAETGAPLGSGPAQVT
jgi:signal peptidase I